MKLNFSKSVFALPFVVLGCWFFLFYQELPGQFPQSEYAAEMAGELSLIQGYVDNGFNFFSPTSLKLNVADDNFSGISAAAFPLMPYLSSFLVASGMDEILAYQSILYVFSASGIIFFLLLCHLFVPSRKWVVVAGCLVASTPAILYLQQIPINVFPAFSLFLGAVYFGSRYIMKKVTGSLYVLFAFALPATLMRPTYVWLLLLLFGWVFYVVFTEKRIKRVPVLVAALWLIGYIGYLVYDVWMTNTYGSIFHDFFSWNFNISHLTTFFSDLLSRSAVLYTLIHAVFIVFGIGLVFSAGKKNRPHVVHCFYVFVLACYLITPLIFLFAAPDYVQSGTLYFDVMLLPFVLVMIIAAKGISEIKTRYYVELVLGVSVLLFLINRDGARYFETKEKNVKKIVTVKNFNHLHKKISGTGMGREDKVLVLGSREKTIPLFLMRQKGYSINKLSAYSTQDIIDIPAEYIAINQSFFIDQVVKPFPEIINYLDVVWSDDYVTLCRKRQRPQNKLLTEYYAEFRHERLRALRTLDVSFPGSFSYWDKIDSVSRDSSSFIIPGGHEFGPTFTTTAGQLGVEDGYEMVLQGDFSLQDATKKTAIVMSMSSEEGDSYFYRALPVSDAACEQEGEMCTQFGAWKLPENIASGDEIKVYVWNEGRQEMRCNNISFVIYGPPLK